MEQQTTIFHMQKSNIPQVQAPGLRFEKNWQETGRILGANMEEGWLLELQRQWDPLSDTGKHSNGAICSHKLAQSFLPNIECNTISFYLFYFTNIMCHKILKPQSDLSSLMLSL